MVNQIYVIMETTGDYEERYSFPIEFVLTEPEAAKRVEEELKQINNKKEVNFNSQYYSEERKAAFDDFELKYPDYNNLTSIDIDQYNTEWIELCNKYPDTFESCFYSYVKVVRK